jgi:hypothetical protein
MIYIHALVSPIRNLNSAMRQLGLDGELNDVRDPTARVVVDGRTKALLGPGPEALRDLNVLGAVPALHATYAGIVAAPRFEIAPDRFTAVWQIQQEFLGLDCVRVTHLGAPQELADVVVASDPAIRRYILDLGLAKPRARVIARVRNVAQVRGMHVVGFPQWKWAQHARLMTIVPESVPEALDDPRMTPELLERSGDYIVKYVQDHTFTCRVDPVDLDEFRALATVRTAVHDLRVVGGTSDAQLVSIARR